ncbi:MAG: hypothetical protein QM715_08085 [Nibricoccus sp.]
MAVPAYTRDREYPDLFLKMAGARRTIPNLIQSITNNLFTLFNERPAYLYEVEQLQQIRSSVLCFGVRPPFGEPNHYASHLKEAVVAFEPRLCPETLSVSFFESTAPKGAHWFFEVKAVLNQELAGHPFRCVVDFDLDEDQAKIL